MHADATAQGGRTYFYRVRAEAVAGWSPWSAALKYSPPLTPTENE